MFFSVSWSQSYIYCFPPFSVIWKVLRKIRDDTAKAIITTPLWPAQSWLPAALQVCTAEPLVFGSRHLELPGTTKKHPLSPQMELLALHVSGDTLKTNVFCRRQKKLSCLLSNSCKTRRNTAKDKQKYQPIFLLVFSGSHVTKSKVY